MNQPAVIIAAHGSHHDATAARIAEAHARRVAKKLGFSKVTAAFHQGKPSYVEAVANASAEEIVVVPLMASAGYFADTVLSKAIAAGNARSAHRVTITAPVGTHPSIAGMVERRIARLANEFDLDPTETAVAIVGHGTTRNPRSRETTVELAHAIAENRVATSCIAVFLDESPGIESVYALVREPNIIVIPMLIGGGYHATRDLPARLSIDIDDTVTLPFVRQVGNRRIVMDIAVGQHDEISDVIANIVQAAIPAEVPS